MLNRQGQGMFCLIQISWIFQAKRQKPMQTSLYVPTGHAVPGESQGIYALIHGGPLQEVTISFTLAFSAPAKRAASTGGAIFG